MMIMGANMPMPESPQAKFWTWIVAVIAGTMGTWLFLDGYFAHRAEAITRAEAETMIVAANTAATASINSNTSYLIDQQSKLAMDTKLFELEQIPPNMLKPQDRALYQKLQRDRRELVDYWIKQGRPLR